MSSLCILNVNRPGFSNSDLSASRICSSTVHWAWFGKERRRAATDADTETAIKQEWYKGVLTVKTLVRYRSCLTAVFDDISL